MAFAAVAFSCQQPEEVTTSSLKPSSARAAAIGPWQQTFLTQFDNDEKCGQIWFFVNFGERLLRNKNDGSIQNINTVLLLPFSYILNAKSFLEVGYK